MTATTSISISTSQSHTGSVANEQAHVARETTAQATDGVYGACRLVLLQNLNHTSEFASAASHQPKITYTLEHSIKDCELLFKLLASNLNISINEGYQILQYTDWLIRNRPSDLHLASNKAYVLGRLLQRLDVSEEITQQKTIYFKRLQRHINNFPIEMIRVSLYYLFIDCKHAPCCLKDDIRKTLYTQTRDSLNRDMNSVNRDRGNAWVTVSHDLDYLNTPIQNQIARPITIQGSQADSLGSAEIEEDLRRLEQSTKNRHTDFNQFISNDIRDITHLLDKVNKHKNIEGRNDYFNQLLKLIEDPFRQGYRINLYELFTRCNNAPRDLLKESILKKIYNRTEPFNLGIEEDRHLRIIHNVLSTYRDQKNQDQIDMFSKLFDTAT